MTDFERAIATKEFIESACDNRNFDEAQGACKLAWKIHILTDKEFQNEMVKINGKRKPQRVPRLRLRD